ncbi:hypothetical protein PLICRDRAFT_41391 [Plicaturopsis crispa FD-325 SS-3]|nr:hypothetical protein PLICRDRAFT_41391 [Plicaturopsis crispa FD-325 SS-3]
MSRQPPPVNLKERIAALQQRSVSPPTQRAPPTTSAPSSKSSSPGTGTVGALRDKIAKFEQRGGVPVPRGSFGLGAPPVVENGQPTKSRELYGNRIPGYVRGPSGGPPISRSGSPLPPPSPRKRATSTSDLDLAAAISSQLADGAVTPESLRGPYSPLPSPVGSVSDRPPPSPRRNSLATPAAGNRRASSESGAFGLYDSFRAPSSSLPSPAPVSGEEAVENASTPPSIVVSPQPSTTSLFSVEETSPVEDNGPPLAKAEPEVEAPAPSSPATDVSKSGDVVKVIDISEVPDAVLSSVDGSKLEQTKAEDRPTLPVSPSGEVSINTEAYAVGEEGKGTSDEGTTTPTRSQPAVPVVPSTNGKGAGYALSSESEQGQIITLDTTGEPGSHSPAYSSPTTPSATRPRHDSVASEAPSDAGTAERPSTESDPGEIAVARRVSPARTRAVPIHVPPPLSSFTEPDDAETSFGYVAIDDGRPPRPPKYANVKSSTKPSFTSVVHRKVSQSASAPAALKAPATPQVTRVRQSTAEQVPPSPGTGELAMLLEEAALLEQRLMSDGSDDEPLQSSEPAAPPRSSDDTVSSVEPYAGIARDSEEEHPPVQAVPPSPPQSPAQSPPQPSSQSMYSVNFASSSTISSPKREPSPSIIRVQEAEDVPPTPPPKSPMPRYLSGRFRNALRPSQTVPGTHPRNSISASSEMSSDDSMAVITPSEGSFDGKMKTDNGDHSNGSGLGIGWPVLSPKKSLSRASSFADKIWHRKRTKSGASAIEETPSHSRPPSIAPLTLTPPEISTPPRRSNTSGNPRPVSWMSDASSMNSPFDHEIFDAFPSVPQELPEPALQPFPASQTLGRMSTSSHSSYRPSFQAHVSPPEFGDPTSPSFGRSSTLPARPHGHSKYRT